MPIHTIAAPFSALLFLTFLAACDRKSADPANPGGSEVRNGTDADRGDPELTDALGNQIVVDPGRLGKTVPPIKERLTLGDAARQQAGGKNCAARIAYDQGWAAKLPAEFPLYPEAKVTEAAGTDAAGCRMRIVSFTSAAPVKQILDFYQGRATRAGYSAERVVEGGGHILAGTRDRDGGVYYMVATPATGGSAIDIIVDADR